MGMVHGREDRRGVEEQTLCSSTFTSAASVPKPSSPVFVLENALSNCGDLYIEDHVNIIS